MAWPAPTYRGGEHTPKDSVENNKGEDKLMWLRIARSRTPFISVMFLSSLFAQMQTVTLTVKDPRPVAAAALDIERRSGLAVNYEDVRYENAGDLQDITDQIMTAAQKAQAIPGVRVIVPRGGELSLPILVDVNGHLPDFNSVSAAANAIIGAHATSPSHSGSFTVEVGDGVLFIEPLQMRDVAGNVKPISPLLSTHVTIPAQSRSGFDTLRLILNQVSQASGFKVDLGTAPARALIASEVVIGANNEPANHVIGRLLASIASAGADVPYSGPAMSYSMLFDPRLRYYALNIHSIPNPNAPKTTRTGITPNAPTKSDGWFKKQND